MANITGTNGNDTLLGTTSADTINGKLGNDTITGNKGNDTLTGGGGKDRFVYNLGDGIDTIIGFGGIGKGTNPTAGVIAEVDTIKFIGAKLTARNLLLTQNGTNLEITFEGVAGTKIILQNFKLEDLENLKASGSTPAIGNILFDGETSITDSFNVLDANSTETTIGIKNTVTFLNDLANNITALDDSNDMVNGQGGDDKIDGLSGNDLLRGGTGNDILVGGAGNDFLDGGIGNDLLQGDAGNDTLNGNSGNDRLNADFSTGNDLLDGGDGNDTLSALGDYYLVAFSNNTLKGGAGDDYLSVDFSEGDNLLSGGDGNDFLSGTGFQEDFDETGTYYGITGNNTLNGGAGDDTLNVDISENDNLISGDDGNDFLTASGYVYENYKGYRGTSGYNTLNGGLGNDTLNIEYSTGDNLLNGGDGNDFLTASYSNGNNTLDGGAGNDKLEAFSSAGDKLLDGGDGNDSVSLSFSDFSNSTLKGGTGNDTLTLGSGELGNCTIDGGTGNNLLYIDYNYATKGITSTFNATTNIGSVTAGTNQVNYKNIEQLDFRGTFYSDYIVGSNGNDILDPRGGGNDTVDGGIGDDLLYFDDYNTGGITSTFNGTTKIGTITAGTTRSVTYKNIEKFYINGTQYNDLIVGGNGNDTLSTGFDGNDTIDGGRGEDLLYVYNNNASSGIISTFNVTSNTGSITTGTRSVSYKNIERLNVIGTDYNDLIVGGNGNDTLSTGFGGNDTVDGGRGEDLLYVYNNNASSGITSTFNANTNTGLITVGTRSVSYKNIEQLDVGGTAYNDLIVGSNGNDTLTGGNGNDSLIGGSGTDTFVFNSFNEGSDRIYDFNATNEVIQVSALGFGGGLSAGILSASQFKIGTSASTSTQRFIYNSTTGALFFDQDGNAGGFTQVQFALVTTGLSLTNTNFVLV
ncbi:hemolysin-type calcium-binding region [Nostoc linckia NIES-25]|nr:hemolysin-type calcium-binding region [Nostoc linckia NIES-25]